MIKVVRNKLNFMAERLESLYNINGYSLPLSYRDSLQEYSFDESISEVNESEVDQDDDFIGSEDSKDSIEDIDVTIDPTKTYRKYTEVSEVKRKLNRAVNKFFVKKKLGQVQMDPKLQRFSSTQMVDGITLAEADVNTTNSDNNENKQTVSGDAIALMKKKSERRQTRLLNTQSSFFEKSRISFPNVFRKVSEVSSNTDMTSIKDESSGNIVNKNEDPNDTKISEISVKKMQPKLKDKTKNLMIPENSTLEQYQLSQF